MMQNDSTTHTYNKSRSDCINYLHALVLKEQEKLYKSGFRRIQQIALARDPASNDSVCCPLISAAAKEKSHTQTQHTDKMSTWFGISWLYCVNCTLCFNYR